MAHKEHHNIHKSQALRAKVMGANDGIISTASLIVGISSAGVEQSQVITTSFAALVAGAMSMAAGEYVSVSSQSDIEKSDIIKEQSALENNPGEELEELRNIYIDRGLDQDLALKVAKQLTVKDPLGTHLRDELGIVDEQTAKPLQAAILSAISFSFGAMVPIYSVWFSSKDDIIINQIVCTLFTLTLLGGYAAYVGGASFIRGAVRVTFWGSLALTITYIVGQLFDGITI